jgi:hypothetical protein
VTRGQRSQDLDRRAGPTQASDVEYYCRGCKGHYSRIVPADAIRDTACRCGSRDLLIYHVAGEMAAPLRN